MSDTLKDADILYQENNRPYIHLTPMHGFMNDPNGLLFYGGRYHYFAQLNPYGLGAGNTHWMHAVSDDLMNWTELPYALLPDDKGLVYSGSGVVDYHYTSGKQKNSHPPIFLFYTSAGSKSKWSRGKYFEIGIAISNDGGKTFIMYKDNPIINHISFMNRDPKVVWNPEEEYWIMALFLDNDRYMLLYSDDLFNWEKGQVIEIKGSAECPDIFRLPLDDDKDNYKWVLWGSTDNYLVGRIENKTFIAETDVIYGPSHMIVSAYSAFTSSSGGYAAQTYFGVPKGRIIQQSWIRTRVLEGPFSSCASIPNELKLVSTKNGPRISVYPVVEVREMYKESFSFKNRGLEELERIPTNYLAECMDMTFTFGIQNDKPIAVSVRGVLIVYNPKSNTLILPNGMFSLGPQTDKLEIRVITDRCSFELYTGDGLFNTVLNTILDPSNIGIKVVSLDPATAVDFELHKLRNAWTDSK